MCYLKNILVVIYIVLGSVVVLRAENKIYKVYAPTTSGLNLRHSPSLNGEVLKTLSRESLLIRFDDEDYDGFYLVYDLGDDVMGYVSRKYLEYIREIEVPVDENVLTEQGTFDADYSKIEILNNTDVKITLRVAGAETYTYQFEPHERREIYLDEGPIDILATSKGVLPYSAYDYVTGGFSYSWEFFIVKKPQRRKF